MSEAGSAAVIWQHNKMTIDEGRNATWQPAVWKKRSAGLDGVGIWAVVAAGTGQEWQGEKDL